MSEKDGAHEGLAGALQQYAAAKNRHDVDGILEMCTEDSSYESVPSGVRVQGKEALRGFYHELFTSLPDYGGRFDGMAQGANSVAVLGHFGGSTTDRFMGLDVAPGRRLEIPVTFVCTYRDGLLASDRAYFDAAALADQLGVPLEVLRPAAAGDAGHVMRLVANFERLWSTKDAAIVREMVRPDATGIWSGLEPVRGDDYPERMRWVMNDLVPDLELTITAHAAAGNVVFISWRATGTIGGSRLEWRGIDEFRLRDGLAVEVHAVFDPGPLRAAIEQAGIGSTR